MSSFVYGERCSKPNFISANPLTDFRAGHTFQSHLPHSLLNVAGDLKAHGFHPWAFIHLLSLVGAKRARS